ncbi:MAG: 1-acyl-sn-glycerol-3-phosphate acyltransferase, partial [Proteobacteria bacterium]|nr:1-acyl-sn-glycerol-3-phosphate acyltransferase [Pseudomonadota bacterium]
VNSGIFWGRRSFRKQPGKIILEYFPPIQPGMGRKAFMQKLETTIEEGSRKLEAEGMAAI